MENPQVTKLKEVITGRAVVYIDAANLELSVKEMVVHTEDVPENLKQIPIEKLRWSMDYRKLHDFFKSRGVSQSIRFYTPDFQSKSHHKFLYFLSKELDFKLVTKPLKIYQDHTSEKPYRKANLDVEIAVDSTFSLNTFDNLILFSGDGDFEYLAKFLRVHGKVVIGFSRIGNVATELQSSLDHFFNIEDFRREFLRLDIKPERPSAFRQEDLLS